MYFFRTDKEISMSFNDYQSKGQISQLELGPENNFGIVYQ